MRSPSRFPRIFVVLVLAVACLCLTLVLVDRRTGSHPLPPPTAAALPRIDADNPEPREGPWSRHAGDSGSGSPRTLAEGRFAGATLVAEGAGRSPDGRPVWVQWLRHDGQQVRRELQAPGADFIRTGQREDIMLADSVVVARPASLTPAEFAHRLSSLGLQPGPQYLFSPVVRVLLPQPLHLDSVPDALDLLGAREPGWSAQPDHLAVSHAVPSDYDPRELWGLARMQAPAAWNVTSGSANLVVGIIDSGLDRTHPDLAANVWRNAGEISNGLDDDGNGLVDDLYGWDFADNDNDSSDQQGHGTHVAGIIGAVGNNGDGVTGVNWNVKLLGIRAGNQTLATSSVIQALDYLTSRRNAGEPIVAVNHSYTSTSFNTLQRDAMQRASTAGMLMVTAAGNDRLNLDAGNNMRYPAGYNVPNLVAVGASNLNDELTDFSNWGSTTVHLAAPGMGIVSTLPGSAYGPRDGTSMASPLVAGAAALLRASEPSLNATALRARLLTSVRPVPGLAGRTVTGGVLDLARLLAPATSLPQVEIVQPSAAVMALETASLSTTLEASAFSQLDGSPQGSLPVVWSTPTGPAPAIFTPLGESSVRASFPQPGIYVISATATHGANSASASRTFIVGSVAPSVSGLIGHWTFSESGGSTALDSSGQARNGTLMGTPERDTGPGLLSALRFGGSLDVMTFAGPVPPATTLAGWIHMDGAGNSIFPRLLHFPTYYLFAGMDDTAAALDANAGTVKFLANWTTNDGVWNTPRKLLSFGRWHHFAATYDSAAGVRALPRLFLDGKELEVTAQAGAMGQPERLASLGYAGNNDDRSRALLGRLADVRIYDRVLPAHEVVLLSREPARQSLFGWQLAILATSASEATLALRRPDGRGPDGSLNVTWLEVSGPGAASLTPLPGSQLGVTFAAAGLHRITARLETDGLPALREFQVTLPGVASPPVVPGIVRMPTSRTVAVGSPVSLSVEATGTPPLTYQWLRDGQPLSGRTEATLAFTSAQAADSGLYTVRIDNPAGSFTSPEISLQVLEPPQIQVSPVGRTLAVGATLQLSVTATGSPPLVYQWRRDGTVLPGATTAVLILSDITAAQSGTYNVVVSNAVGSVTSADAVVNILLPPSVLSQSSSQTLLVGRTLGIGALFAGSPPLTYRWTRNGQLVAGQTEPSLRFDSISLSDAGSYVLTATNAVGSAATAPIVLEVVTPPAITQHPANVSGAAGATVTLSVTATGTGPLQYQWSFAGEPLPGATSNSLVVNNLRKENAGTYTVRVTNDYGSVNSLPATVTLLLPPEILSQTNSLTVEAGRTVVLEVAVGGTPPLTFSWFKDGSRIDGATDPSLRFTTIKASDAGSYLFRVSNSVGVATAQPIVLIVGAAPAFLRHPASQRVPAGQAVTFSVEVSGSPVPTLQWYRNDVPLQGRTSASLTISNAGTADAGSYRAVATSAAGSVSSQTATLEIVVPPVIGLQPAGSAGAPGATLQLEAAASSSPDTIVRWWQGGQLVSAASTPTLTLPGLTAGSSGVYLCEFSNAAGVVRTLPAFVGLQLAEGIHGDVATRTEWLDILHPNGARYDQHVLSGAAGAITARPGRVARISFLDQDGDIVQAELFGAGTLTIRLANPSGPAEAERYLQPGVFYMKGEPTLVLAGADASTHFSVYSVGPANNPGVIRPGIVYEGWATLRAVGIVSSAPQIGGIRLGNVRFTASAGATGLWAPGVTVATVCYLSDLASTDDGLPFLGLGTGVELGVTGGNLLQSGGRPVIVSGIGKILPLEGTSSAGQRVGPRQIEARFLRDGVDVTATLLAP